MTQTNMTSASAIPTFAAPCAPFSVTAEREIEDDILFLKNILQTPDLFPDVIKYVNQKLLFRLKSRFGDEMSQLAPELREAAESFRQFTGACQEDCTCGQCSTR